MDTPADRKATKKCRLREKRAAAHLPTPIDETATSSTSKNITSALSQPALPLWDSLSNVRQEAENYFHKQQLRTARIAIYLIVEPTTTANQTAPEYTETVTLPAQSARDNGDTVEQVDAKLLRMEQCWAESRSSLFPESIRSAIAVLRLAVERKETEAAWNAAVQVCAVHAAELEEQSEGGLEEEEESERRSEEENERRINEEEETEFTKEVRTETTGDDAPRHQPAQLNWATNIDESIGPVPCVTDFRPTMPSQPVRAPPKRTVAQPNAPALVDPDPSDVAPGPEGVPPASAAPTEPAPIIPKPEPVPGALINPSLNAPVASPDPIPAFAKPSPIVPVLSTPSIVHGPCNFSALRSDTRNPWSSLNHRRRRPYSHTHYTDLRLKLLNHSNLPPLHLRHSVPSVSPVRHSPSSQSNSYLHPWHPEPFRLAKPHVSAAPQPPVNIFQVIQHPHGISSTKPKITKNIPAYPILSADTQEYTCVRCACSAASPVHGLDRGSWRLRDPRWRFGRRFSRRFHSRSWDWERGRSHFRGGWME
jgi:hypothetical protein